MRRIWILVSIALLAGCAGGQQAVTAPPVAEDLAQVGWSKPVAAPPTERPPATAVTEPTDARSPREKVFAYTAGDVYAVNVPLGAPMDIVLQPGERIHNLVGGDRTPAPDGQETSPPWEVKEGLSGAGIEARPHVFVTAVRPGLRTGLSITTTKRTYYLDLRSVGRSPVRSVRWTYPDEAMRLAAKAPEPSPLPDPAEPRAYHVPYTITASQPRPPWTVRQVVDDGWKTYLIFPPTVTTIDAPLVRLIGPNGPEVLNARQVGSVMILDRIIHRLELRIGTGDRAEVVTVQRETPRTIHCPGHEECPVWPEAVARRVP
jgi:P-type conjugative transfer protein TrbG